MAVFFDNKIYTYVKDDVSMASPILLTGIAHELKTVQPFFDQLKARKKTLEMRLDDRNYRVGDTLVLKEYDKGDKRYTGNFVVAYITCITEGEEFGIVPGFVALSICFPDNHLNPRE